MDNIFCIECGFELPSTAKFCLRCGDKIPEIVISDPEITKEENIESESKPITQTLKKTTPKTSESKAMAIGTTLLEWIIILVVAFLVGGLAALFGGGTRWSSIGAFIAFLVGRIVVGIILKSILPLRYQNETDGEEDEEVDEEVKKDPSGQLPVDIFPHIKEELNQREIDEEKDEDEDEDDEDYEYEEDNYGTDSSADKLFVILPIIGLIAFIIITIVVNLNSN